MSGAGALGPRVILVIVKVLLRALVFLCLAGAVSSAQSPLMGIASEELERNFRILKEKTDPPPYFLAYEISDLETHEVGATLGVLNSQANSHNRFLDEIGRAHV